MGLGSGIRIPVLGSNRQRIPDLDPQHSFQLVLNKTQDIKIELKIKINEAAYLLHSFD
jgi:hypothetical protein